ncbi:MAG: MFS transporter [Providencia sp.]|uniref:MFS transporter n=1 Tax=Providencia sp. TaxID=589 RepID=UPI003F9431A7
MQNINSLKRYLIALSLPIFLSSLSTSITNIAVPSLISAFNASFSQAQWVIVAYLITLTSAAILTGSLGDRINRRTILLFSLSLFIIASTLSGLSPTINWLIGFRILQGVAAAGMINTTMAMIAGLNAKNKGGFAMGLIGSLSAIGTAAGPTLGGLLINLWGWQAIFLINIPFSIIALFLIIRFVPKPASDPIEHKPIDILGLSLLTMAIILYTFSIVNWGSYSFLLIALSVMSVISFVIVEKRIAHPVISIELLKQPILFIGVILSLLVATVMMTTLIVGPFYLLYKLVLSPWQMGLVMSCGPIVAACVGLPAGKLVDKFNPNTIIFYALICMVSGFTLFALFAQHLSISLYLLFITLITSGYAAFQAANNTAILFGVNSNKKSLLAGVINLSRNLGLINGAALMATLFAFAAGGTMNAAMPQENIVAGFRLTFAISAVLMFVALNLLFFHQRYVTKQNIDNNSDN